MHVRGWSLSAWPSTSQESTPQCKFVLPLGGLAISVGRLSLIQPVHLTLSYLHRLMWLHGYDSSHADKKGRAAWNASQTLALLPFQSLPRVLCPRRRRRPNSIIRQQPQACWKSLSPSRVSPTSPRRRPSAATFASPGSRHPCALPVYFSVLAPRTCFLGLELLLLLFHVVVHQNTQSRDLLFVFFFLFPIVSPGGSCMRIVVFCFNLMERGFSLINE